MRLMSRINELHVCILEKLSVFFSLLLDFWFVMSLVERRLEVTYYLTPSDRVTFVDCTDFSMTTALWSQFDTLIAILRRFQTNTLGGKTEY